jgi:hypothetical protein
LTGDHSQLQHKKALPLLVSQNESISNGNNEEQHYARHEGRMNGLGQIGEACGAIFAGLLFVTAPLLPFLVRTDLGRSKSKRRNFGPGQLSQSSETRGQTDGTPVHTPDSVWNYLLSGFRSIGYDLVEISLLSSRHNFDSPRHDFDCLCHLLNRRLGREILRLSFCKTPQIRCFIDLVSHLLCACDGQYIFRRWQ